MGQQLRQIPARIFKAECLRLMDEVRQQRTPSIITKRGKPVAKLAPVEDEPLGLFGWMKGTGAVDGDIVGPLDVVWSADAEPR